jgi:hypothetical protein
VQIAGRLDAGKHPLLDGHAGTPSIATPDGMTGGRGARGGPRADQAAASDNRAPRSCPGQARAPVLILGTVSLRAREPGPRGHATRHRNDPSPLKSILSFALLALGPRRSGVPDLRTFTANLGQARDWCLVPLRSTRPGHESSVHDQRSVLPARGLSAGGGSDLAARMVASRSRMRTTPSVSRLAR